MPKFELGKFCESVQMYKATVSYIVPPIALGLAKHPMVDQYDLSSLRFLMCGKSFPPPPPFSSLAFPVQIKFEKWS